MTTPGYALSDLASTRVGAVVHYTGSLTEMHGDYAYGGDCLCGDDDCFGSELVSLTGGRNLLCVRGASFVFVQTDGGMA